MRLLLPQLCLIASFLHAQKQDSIVIRGTYQGKNLYVQNPSSQTGFCIIGVTVNYRDLFTNYEGFEVDLYSLGLKIGDSVRIAIFHKTGCSPRILNPECLFPKSSFAVTKLQLDSSGLMTWETDSETSTLPFYIEQFRWKRWITLGKIDGQGKSSGNLYEFRILHFHSGRNKFRLKQIDCSDKPRLSDSLIFVFDEKPVTFVVSRIKKRVEFSRPTLFEVYDKYGILIKKGFGKEVELLNAISDLYYLNYDNLQSEFIIY
jgi:hypothetical protein